MELDLDLSAPEICNWGEDEGGEGESVVIRQ